MRFEFDPRKAAANLRKHGVELSDTEAVFNDPLAIHMEDPDVQGERRFVAVGRGNTGLVTVVAYTYRGATIRVISARRASRKERLKYESRIRLL
jgi:uncharacterized DUF497 family protein